MTAIVHCIKVQSSAPRDGGEDAGLPWLPWHAYELALRILWAIS